MIKAIETRYKGYRFRSRLEARWAVFFDALGAKWEYEKEGYNLGDAGLYLPDFWLPNVWDRTCKEPGVWIEIKPVEFTEEESAKCRGLAFVTRSPVIEFWDVPGGNEGGNWWSAGPIEPPNAPDEWSEIINGEYAYVSWDNCMVWHKCHQCNAIKIEFDNDYHDCPRCKWSSCTQFHPAIKVAADAARAARFEHGERGR